jgi:hypothetical protein
MFAIVAGSDGEREVRREMRGARFGSLEVVSRSRYPKIKESSARREKGRPATTSLP